MATTAHIILDQPADKYHAAPGVSASVLVHGLKSMKHMHAAMTHHKESTAAMAFGTLTHAAVLEWDRFAASVVFWDGTRNTAKLKKDGSLGNPTDWEGFRDANADKIILTHALFADLGRAKDAVMADSECRESLRGESCETSCYWTDDRYGAGRCRFDVLGVRGFTDLKTTGHVKRENFINAAERLGYYLKFGWYAHGWRQLRGRLPGARVVVLSHDKSTDCFDAYCLRINPASLEAWEVEAVNLAKRYQMSERDNTFPGMSGDGVLADFARPKWATGGDGDGNPWSPGEAGDDTESKEGE